MGGVNRPAFLLLYGVRLWVAVCLALFLAFWLQMENPFWAGTSAAIVCQPVLGASLRKGWFRMIGTVIGGVFIVVLTGIFPQQRVEFLIALALWCALCGFFATLLRNFSSYAAALAGYTAAIIAGDQLGLVGGPNGQAFSLAVMRVSEICLGIVCAGLVLATTEFGEARQRLAAQLADLGSLVLRSALDMLRLPPDRQGESRMQRRAIIGQVIALDTVIDQVLGEESALRFQPRRLQAAVDGLFYALSAWRAASGHIERAGGDAPPPEAAVVLDALPSAVTAAPDAAQWRAEPGDLSRAFLGAARRLVGLPADTLSLRLLADRSAELLLGLRHILDALVLLQHPRAADPRRRTARLRVPDVFPALVNAIRCFLTVGAAALIWIITAWPGGSTMLIFAAVTVTLFSPRAEAAFETARNFMIGTAITAILAWVVGFGILPRMEGFAAFAAAIGLVLIPGGALSAGTWLQPLFVALTANFIPLLDPANPMSFDVAQFDNTAMALLAGVGLAMASFRLLPPVSIRLRTERLLLLTLRDLRRVASGRLRVSAADWEGRIYSRLTALPTEADTLHGARLVAAMSVGVETIRLLHLAPALSLPQPLRRAISALARGDIAVTLDALRQFETDLGTAAQGTAENRLRARAAGRELAETVAEHASYFGAAPVAASRKARAV